MYAASRLRRRGQRADYWPGFVDLLSTLLLVMIFLLVVYMLAQYFLQRTLSEETEQKDDLNVQLRDINETLTLEQQANADLRIDIAQLSSQLQSSLSVRDQLIAELSMMTGERDTLQLRLREMTGEGQTAFAEAAQASIRADAGEEKIKVLLADLERLRRDIDALQAVRTDLELKVATLAAALVESQDEVVGRQGELDASREETARLLATLTALRDTTAELETRLSDEGERTALAQRTLEEREIRLAEVQALHLAAQSSLADSDAALGENRTLSARQRDQIAVLNQQLDALRSQLGRPRGGAPGLRARERGTAGDDRQSGPAPQHGARRQGRGARRLPLGVLRQAQGGAERPARLHHHRRPLRLPVRGAVRLRLRRSGPGGRGASRAVRDSPQEVMVRIPPELPWILQVDGHTDRRPIQTVRFPSNWELSAARAISVVNFLIDLGIPPHHLSATGYGEFQPIDAREDEIGYRRNRRIELKLTQR